MSQKITELEHRISDLHWIKKEEIFLDSMVALGAGPPVNSAELDSTIPVAGASSLVVADINPATRHHPATDSTAA